MLSPPPPLIENLVGFLSRPKLLKKSIQLSKVPFLDGTKDQRIRKDVRLEGSYLENLRILRVFVDSNQGNLPL